MKFFIDSKSYFRREEKNGAFSVMVRATNQTIHLNRSSRPLFEKTDEWINLSDFVKELNVKNVPLERLERDYMAALFRLHACGAAKIEDFPKIDESGTRKAEAKDYYALSKFCAANSNGKYSVAESLSPAFYALYPMYDRLLSASSFTIISLTKGKIDACLMFSLSNRSFGGLTLNLTTAIFDDDLAEKDADAKLAEMLTVAKDFAKGKVVKIRYEEIHPRQAVFVKKLVKNGFTKTAALENELETGQDLTLYDFLL